MAGSRWRAAGLLAAIAVSSCDPGITLHPVESKDIEGIHLTIGRLGGLIGSTWLTPELDVDNPTDAPFIVDGGTLETKGQRYEMQLAGDGGERWRSAAPHSTARIPLPWHFEQPLYEVLGDQATVTLRYRIGSRSEVLVVHFGT